MISISNSCYARHYKAHSNMRVAISERLIKTELDLLCIDVVPNFHYPVVGIKVWPPMSAVLPSGFIHFCVSVNRQHLGLKWSPPSEQLTFKAAAFIKSALVHYRAATEKNCTRSCRDLSRELNSSRNQTKRQLCSTAMSLLPGTRHAIGPTVADWFLSFQHCTFDGGCYLACVAGGVKVAAYI